MKQLYQVEIEGPSLPKDFSKDIAAQLDFGFLLDKAYLIHVKKVEVSNLKGRSPYISKRQGVTA